MSPEKSEKYVISLDAVDINLLASNFKSQYDYVPLWNAHYKENDYYEFKIKNIDEDEDDEIPDIKCHICNIYVPTPYLKNHHDSFKHKINTKIAETALERLKDNMINHNYCDNDTNKSLHFCPTCVVVIKVKDKEKHENSLGHKNSLMIDKFLHDFYVMYNNDEIGHDDRLNTSELNVIKKASCDVEFISANRTDFDNDSNVLSNDISIKSDKNSESSDTRHNTSTSSTKIVDFTNDGNRNKVKASKEKTTSESLQIPNIFDDKINESIVEKETADSEDGFITKTNKKRKSKWKVNKEINNTPPVKIEESQRKLEIVSTVTTVAETKIIPKIDSKVIKTKKSDKTIKARSNNGLACKICDNKNKDHNICEFLTEALTNYDKIPEMYDVLKDLHYHLVMRSDTPFCMVCNLNCSFVDIIAHLFSDEHFDKYERVVRENFLIVEDDFTICQACNVIVKKELKLLHCEDMTHITKQEMYKKKLKK